MAIQNVFLPAHDFKFLIIITLITVFCLVKAEEKNQNLNEFEDLRISRSSFSGPLNYGSAPTDTDTDLSKKINGQTNKQEVKPVVSLLTTEPELGTLRAKVQGRKQLSANQRLPPTTITQLNQSSALLFRKLIPYGFCKWMPLNEFKNISLDNNEIIIRDVEERPCYILSIRAHLKWKEDDYFPFSNLKSLPYANKIVFESPSDGASVRLPLNCSFMNTNGKGGATSLHLPIHKPAQMFREEITILADCGFFILQIYCDGSYLSLESVSFYQNADIPSQVPIDKSSKESLRIAPQLRSEHLVFTTEGTSNYPLFIMPISSRYICQNRLELAGINNVTLIMDRFELLRLSFPVQKENSTSLKSEKKGDQDLIKLADKENGKYSRLIRELAPLHKNHLTMDIQCPNPDSKSPSSPLTSMMSFKGARNSNYNTQKIVAGSWGLSKSAAATLWHGQWQTTIQAKFTYLCGFYLAGFTMERLSKVSHFGY